MTEALDREVARQVTSALTEVVRRGTGQQARIGRPTAGKTGTSQSHRDAWFVGYTPEMSTAVWVGFPEGQISMESPTTQFSITGGTWPALIWSRFSAAALTGVPYGQLELADGSGMVTVEVDLSTGFLAGPLCPRAEVHRIQMPADSVPSVICPIHNPAGLTEIGAGTVPDVIGLDIAGAVEKLEAAGYSVAADWDEPGPLFPGTVYAQDPQGSVAAQAGATVRLTVAGPEPGTVTPFVLGLLRDDALALLNAAGLQVEVITRAESDPEDASARTGAVWSQQPASGAPPLTGNVTIWVNP